MRGFAVACLPLLRLALLAGWKAGGAAARLECGGGLGQGSRAVGEAECLKEAPPLLRRRLVIHVVNHGQNSSRKDKEPQPLPSSLRTRQIAEGCRVQARGRSAGIQKENSPPR